MFEDQNERGGDARRGGEPELGVLNTQTGKWRKKGWEGE